MTHLSDRLSTVASMVTYMNSVADIGCDHAYLSIYLINEEIASKVIACDINKGPVEIAKANIMAAGLSEEIEVRLADGLTGVAPGEVQSVVIAGMGGKLMTKIIDEGKNVLDKCEELIIEPQSDVEYVRRFLENNGYHIVSEDMVCEDNKFYPIIKAIHGKMELEEQVYYRYGKILLREENPILHAFLIKEREYLSRLMRTIRENDDGDKAKNRIEELICDIKLNELALQIMNDADIYQQENKLL